VSIAGVVHTAAPSAPGGTVKVCQRIAPLRSSMARTLPQACVSSLLGPDVPRKSVPFRYTGLPKTLEFSCVVSVVSQRLAPLASANATRRGPPCWATGTNAAGPPGASRSMAAVPTTGAPTSFDHSCLPVTALSA